MDTKSYTEQPTNCTSDRQNIGSWDSGRKCLGGREEVPRLQPQDTARHWNRTTEYFIYAWMFMEHLIYTWIFTEHLIYAWIFMEHLLYAWILPEHLIYALDAGGQQSLKLPQGGLVEQAYCKMIRNVTIYHGILRIHVWKYRISFTVLKKATTQWLRKENW